MSQEPFRLPGEHCYCPATLTVIQHRNSRGNGWPGSPHCADTEDLRVMGVHGRLLGRAVSTEHCSALHVSHPPPERDPIYLPCSGLRMDIVFTGRVTTEIEAFLFGYQLAHVLVPEKLKHPENLYKSKPFTVLLLCSKWSKK